MARSLAPAVPIGPLAGPILGSIVSGRLRVILLVQAPKGVAR